MAKTSVFRALFLAAVLVYNLLPGKVRAAVSPGTVIIPCGDSAALVAAVWKANLTPGPDVLHLAPDCVYTFTTAAVKEIVWASMPPGYNALPIITDTLTIMGHGATLERSESPETPYFRLVASAPGAALTIDRLILQNGKSNDNGGAIYSSGPLQVKYATFKTNTAASGGALYLAGTAEITHSLFTENSADGSGGAVIMLKNWPSSAVELSITNSTFTKNQATNGFALVSNTVTLLQHVTFAENQHRNQSTIDSGYGAVATANFGKIALSNTILSNAPYSDCYGQIVDQGGNIQSGTNCGAAIPTGNPMLLALGDNGGPTWTMDLDAGSPALNAGIPLSAVTSDQRGAPRPSGDGYDSGAVEAGGMITGQIAVQPQSVLTGERAWVTVTLENRTGTPVEDWVHELTLPEEVIFDDSAAPGHTCGAGASVLESGQSFRLTGLQLPVAQRCEVQVPIMSNAPGQFLLHSGSISIPHDIQYDLFDETLLTVQSDMPPLLFLYLPFLQRK